MKKHGVIGNWWSFARPRLFGVMKRGWPFHRSGRWSAVATEHHDEVERHFRQPDRAVPAYPKAAPTHLSLTNLTLCPRLEMNWQSYQSEVREVRIRETHAAPVFQSTLSPVEPDQRRQIVSDNFYLRSPSPEPLRARHRAASDGRRLVNAGRSPRISQPVPPGMDVVRDIAKAGRSPNRNAMRMVFRSAEQMERLDRVLKGQAKELPQWPTQRRLRRSAEADTTVWADGSRPRQMPRTTVARRIFFRMPDDVAQTEARVRKTSVGASLEDVRQRRDAPGTERIYRAAQAEAKPLPVISKPVVPHVSREQPQLDIAQLDKELWRRFERRMRVEHERQGRG